MGPHDQGGGTAMAYWTRDDVIAAITRDFPDEDLATMLAVLDEYGVERYERERERVQLAIIALSSGNIDRLLDYIDLAKKDWRDILFWPDGPAIPAVKETSDSKIIA
jgi:hypothetical protein